MISNETINGLVKYFEAKGSRTEQEQKFLDELKNYADIFPITGVSREDLEDRGFDGSKITDSQMSRLARKMGDDYCEQMFWESMEIIATFHGLPMRPRLVKVEWDTDGETVEDLPTEVEVPRDIDDEDITVWLSDKYGYCLFGWSEIERQ